MSALPQVTGRVLLVRAGGRDWALPLERLLDVGALGAVLALPQAPSALCGAVAHHGEVVPVYDLARLLDLEDAEPGALVFARRAGDVIGLRLAAIEGVRRDAGPDAALLDLDALKLPAAQPRPVVSEGAVRRAASAVPPPPARGLAVRLGGRGFFVGFDQVLALLEAPRPVPVPWADPRVPAIVMHAGEAIPVVRLDLLMGLLTPQAGPFMICRAGRDRVAVQLDAAPVQAERGGAPPLDLHARLAALPGAGQGVASVQIAAALTETSPYLGIVLAAQCCLLPLGAVRAVSAHVTPIALPGAPAGLLGARASRGTILPVVDARRLLRLDAETPARVDVELALPGQPGWILAAQALDMVVRLESGAIHPGPGGAVPGVARIGGRLAWVLDPAALIPNLGLPA